MAGVLPGAPAPVWSDPSVAVAEQQDGLAEGAHLGHKRSVNGTPSQRQGCVAGGGNAAFGHAGQSEPWELCWISSEPA